MMMAATAGMCRMEIAEARIENLLRNCRGLQLNVAKSVRGKYGKESHMRVRRVPLNIDLYNYIVDNIDVNQKYIIPRIRGNFNKPYNYRYLFSFFENNEIGFTIHMCRHYYKSMIWSWMIRNKQPDVGILKELMGHTKTVHEAYGRYTWEYKLAIVDSVFCETPPQSDDLQESIVKAIKNGFDSVQSKNKSKMEINHHSFITNWIGNVMKQFTPSDLYEAIINDDELWANISDNLRVQIIPYKEYFNKINTNMFLQLIKENNLDLYSIIINSPGGVSWIHKQLENIKKQITIYTI